jgi:hypothetical protein
MSDPDLYRSIKTALDAHFGFLMAHGFGDFRVEQIGTEFHFININDRVEIAISFEDRLLAPIWVCIDRNFGVEVMGVANPLFDELARQRKSLTEQWLAELQDRESYQRYNVRGRELNDRYLQLAANTLQQNSRILTGDYRY